MITTNPLRYPGAKSKLVPYIKELLISENLTDCVFLEAYGGSAAVSLALLREGIVSKIKINEFDPLIYSFWYSVFNHTDELIAMINETDISLENWNYISQYRDPEFIRDKDIVEIGFAGLFLNRTNFSGILKANPLGGKKQESKYKIDCRFNKVAIVKCIEELSTYRKHVSVYNMDALAFLQRHTRYNRHRKTFAYIDPPYYEKGPGLYRHFYTHENHLALANFMKNKAYPWLISYDDTEEIRDMYSTSKKQTIYLDYSINTHRKGEELLISNLEIPPMTGQIIQCKSAV